MSNSLIPMSLVVRRHIAVLTLLMVAAVAFGGRSADAAPAASPSPAAKAPARPTVLLAVQLESRSRGRHVVIHPVLLTANATRGTIRVGDQGGPSQPSPSAAAKREPFLAMVALEPTIVEASTPRQIRLQIDFSIDNNGRTVKKTFTTTVISGLPWIFEQDDPDLGETCRLEITATAVGPDEEVVRDPSTGKHVVRRRAAR